MSTEENKVVNDKKYTDIESCVKDQVSKGESRDNALILCEKLVEPQDEEEKPVKEITPTDEPVNEDKKPINNEEQKVPENLEQNEEMKDKPPVEEKIVPPVNEMDKPDGVGGFGEYNNFEECLQDQLGQGLINKDAIVNCAAQLLQTMETLGMATQNPEVKGEFNVNGARISAASFPQNKDECYDTFIKSGLPEEEAKNRCNSIFTAKIKKVENQKINKFQIDTIKRLGDRTDSKNGRLYVRAFLLDPSVNANDWGVNEASIEDRINSFIGKPLVLTENFDHPELSDMTLGHALQYQDLYRIGTIIDITKTNKDERTDLGKIYYAICEITDENAKKAFMEHDLPLYVSPAIAQLDFSENSTDISQWAGMHLAIVSEPAFGAQKAMINGQCTGDEDRCLLNLRKAHIEKHGYGSCGFCSYKKLTSILIANVEEKEKEVEKVEQKVNEASINIKEGENNNSSLLDENTNKKSHMTESKEVDNKSLESEVKTEEKKVEKSFEFGADFVDAKILKLEAENHVLKEEHKRHLARIKELESKNKELNFSIQRERIASIVTAELIPDEELRIKTIEKFTESGLTPEMVYEIYDPIRGALKTAKSADAKVPLVKVASRAVKDVDFESANLAKDVRSLFIKKDGN